MSDDAECPHDWTPWQYGGPRLNGEVLQQERLCVKCSLYQWRPVVSLLEKDSE